MKVIGIVSEYNPFHMGHDYHIKESVAATGDDAAVVCVMSGNYVQRGEPAVFSKNARAAAAARSGCDLVFELPVPWVLSSAEGFARGAISILGNLGIVDYLSFGSESGDLSKLGALAEALLDPGIVPIILEELDKGVSYPFARQKALERELGSMASLLDAPNDILAVEYLKAIYDQNLKLKPIAIKRVGAGHDRRTTEGFLSASELRTMLDSGKKINGLIPRTAEEVFRRELEQGRGPVTMGVLELAMLSRLRVIPEAAYDSLTDASEGLGNRLCRAAREEASIDGILAQTKTKRYAMSRIRRMVMCAALGVTADMQAGTPGYARLLAATQKGRELLRQASGRSNIPIITKPAEIRQLPSEDRRIFDAESSATDLYVLGYQAMAERRGGSDWRKSPAII